MIISFLLHYWTGTFLFVFASHLYHSQFKHLFLFPAFLIKIHLLLPFSRMNQDFVSYGILSKALQSELVMMSSCLQQHWQCYTHSTSFSPWLTLEQRAHSWRRATRAEEKKKKMLKNMMQASLTYWVVLCVCVCVFILQLSSFVWQKTPNCDCSASLQATH